MDWSSLEKFGLRVLGAVIPIPGGSVIANALADAIGASDAKPETIMGKLESSADAVAKALAFQDANRAAILQIQVNAEIENRKADSADVAQVNTTMQAEAKSEHWIQWIWRPLSGILFAPTIIFYYIVFPSLGVKLPDVDPMVWTMWGAILGVTAWHRGVGQNLAIKNRNDS
jgi:hypothetical protein